ncbi:hypothetical protein [Pseudorhodoplanes sp.]|jgi:hypothetical protein|uniref:hypothetical protein n=1 Tax=Pseudorhodoplanes sp. TaxID=1934341 RepID=UPI002BF771F2|nr:hypothetical protein [Pseudorhodoplanes sp.]HWV40738.1 hypothetical protein [Pseudorhodoplanes sp.]
MAIDSKSAAEIIMTSYRSLAVEIPEPAPLRAAAAAKGMPQDFCKVWPAAKPILTALATLVLMLPGYGQVAAGVLTGLIAVGDKIAGDLCK